ncbi:MAG: class I SAM-dependent methyltransferase [Deltaproteobacteria bacterium]|nr:class I SAM-dependent methyltransferase [Deltaproteobacteria bacterium]
MHNIDPCIICNTSRWRLIHQRGPWRYLRCRGCGLVTLYPKPTPRELIKSYDHYLPVRPDQIDQWSAMMKPVIQTSAGMIESQARTRSGRILDVGCGYGFFLREMMRRGWQVEGIEISPIGRAYAVQKWGMEIHSRPLEELGLPENRFDVITLFYVIEHVSDPIGLMKEVHRILKPGGLIFLRWPHSTPIIRFIGPFSRYLDLYHTPYHLFDFNPSTIKKLLAHCGFADPQTRIGGHTLPHDRLGRWASIFFGRLGETLFSLSGGNIILPGVSKSTYGFKD